MPTLKDPPPYDPKLRSIMHEVGDVLKKHDVGGFMILTNGEGNSEYRLFIDTPTWTTLQFIKGRQGIHFKGHAKSKPVETNKTVNMIWHLLDIMGHNFLVVSQIKDMIAHHMNVDETKGKNFHGPYPEDK